MHNLISAKVCLGCKLNHTTNCFYKNKRKRDGLSQYCKSCTCKCVAEWNVKNKEKRAVYQKTYSQKNRKRLRVVALKWQKKNRERVSASRKRWVEKFPEKELRRRLRYHNKISLEKFEEMFRIQGGVCAICYNEQEQGKRLCVDHCHKTQTIRGLLCTKCNTALGLFRDDTTIIKGALNYLSK